MGAPESIAVLVHPVQGGLPVAIDLVKEDRLTGQLLADILSHEDVLKGREPG